MDDIPDGWEGVDGDRIECCVVFRKDMLRIIGNPLDEYRIGYFEMLVLDNKRLCIIDAVRFELFIINSFAIDTKFENEIDETFFDVFAGAIQLHPFL